jgi:hypothetical protein
MNIMDLEKDRLNYQVGGKWDYKLIALRSKLNYSIGNSHVKFVANGITLVCGSIEDSVYDLTKRKYEG